LHYEDRPVVDFFRGLLFENNIRPVTIGIDVPAKDEYEAARIAPEIIKGCDCVVAIQTKRYQMVNGAYKPSEWTLEEPRMGLDSSKPLYLFYEKGIEVKGANATSARTRTEFDRSALETQRGQTGSHIHRIRDELSQAKKMGLLATIGTVALIGAGAYALYRLWNRE